MSRTDFLEQLEKHKQESIDRENAYQKRFKQDQKQIKKGYRGGKETDYAAYLEQAREQAKIEDE